VTHEPAIDMDGIRNKSWLWLLMLPCTIVWVPLYNKLEPTVCHIPFFYWYQMLWVLISALITAVVHVRTKPLHGTAAPTPVAPRISGRSR
jgi:hypothetical protein